MHVSTRFAACKLISGFGNWSAFRWLIKKLVEVNIWCVFFARPIELAHRVIFSYFQLANFAWRGDYQSFPRSLKISLSRRELTTWLLIICATIFSLWNKNMTIRRRRNRQSHMNVLITLVVVSDCSKLFFLLKIIAMRVSIRESFSRGTVFSVNCACERNLCVGSDPLSVGSAGVLDSLAPIALCNPKTLTNFKISNMVRGIIFRDSVRFSLSQSGAHTRHFHHWPQFTFARLYCAELVSVKEKRKIRIWNSAVIFRCEAGWRFFGESFLSST